MTRRILSIVRKLLPHLLFSIIAWSGAVGLYILIREVGAQPLSGWDPDNTILASLWVVASVLFGIAFQLITLMAETRAFRSRSFGLLILAKSIAMLASVIIYMVIRGVIAVAVGAMEIGEAWREGLSVSTTPEMAVILLYVWLTAVVFGFVRQMSAMAGPRVLVNLLLGKYRNPKTETRIFMFLDMEGSTTIAERLGHEKFFRLIQECFRDGTERAIRCNVEIYQ